MAGRAKSGHFHCGEVLRRSWCPYDEDYPAVLPQIFGLCCEWYLAQKKLNWAADFEFALFPYLVNGIKNHLEEAYFRDMSGCELAEIEQAAGEKCQPIGHIGYYYPAEVWISEYGKLYAKYEYQDEIECFPDVFALIERELRQCKFDSAAMKTVEALDGKL